MNDRILSIDEMKERIEIYGKREIWVTIEKLDNCLTRLAYRQLYFLAGGDLDFEN